MARRKGGAVAVDGRVLSARRTRMLAFAAVVLMVALVAALRVPAGGVDDDGVAAAARSELLVGGMVSGYDTSWPDERLLETAADEFSAVTAAAYLPWGAWPDPDEPVQTAGLDLVVDWAVEHDLAVHGHTLVYPWANAQSDWWADLEEGHEAHLEHFVTEMVASNAGEIWVWDVVNEVIAPTGAPADPWGLRSDVIEHREIGPNYVDLAFEWADAADPEALLILNDFGAEERNDKSDRLFAYVQELRRRGVPIDGVGFQFHVLATEGEPNWASVRSNLARFVDAGFRVFITELDVPVVAAAADEAPTAADLERQRAIFEEVARIATELEGVDSLLLWDWVDQRSWLHPIRHDMSATLVAGVYTHPTPWTEDDRGRIRAKPAVDGLVEGLSNPHRRSTPDGHRRIMARVDGEWQLLVRGGRPEGNGWEPTSSVLQTERTDESRTWTTVQWSFEEVRDGVFRIANRWEEATGWLARDGESVVVVERSDAPELLWRLEPLGDSRWRVVNLVEPSSGVLTFDADGRPHLSAEDGSDAQIVRLYRS